MILSSKFEQLQAGDTFTTGARTVTQEDVVAFAERTGDLHPQHLDAEWAAASPFGRRIAPGLLTLSCSFGLVRADPECAIGLRAMNDVIFTRPVEIGDTISVRGRINSLRPWRADAGLVGLTLTTANQHERTVCRARIEMLWKRGS